MKRSQKRGYEYEKVKARERKSHHKGGPGSPDYVRGGVKGEVKNWSRPVDRNTLKKLFRKGINEVVSKNDFTEPAKKYAQEKHIRLIKGKRVILRKK